MTALRRKSVACLVVTALMNGSLWGQGPAPAVSDQGIAPRIRTALESAQPGRNITSSVETQKASEPMRDGHVAA